MELAINPDSLSGSPKASEPFRPIGEVAAPRFVPPYLAATVIGSVSRVKQKPGLYDMQDVLGLK